MSDPTAHNTGKEVLKDNQSPGENALIKLRGLLLGPVQIQLSKIQDRLDKPELHANDVSRVLPESIILRSTRDKQISKSLEPIIEEAIKTSIKKDPKVLADALFPVMGPAIRKAIYSTIRGMIQTLNQILEYRLSLQGLKWRLEAFQTKKSFGEVVLLHTLVYHVEQVLLIHRNTGLVLQYAVSKEVPLEDPDLVSSMLTAIQDFVKDSFGAEKEETLETLSIGDRSVWIEQGPQAVLAAVIHGNAPTDFHSVLAEALDAVHLKQRSALEFFDGDNTPFKAIKADLEKCLHYQVKQQKQKTSPVLWILLGAVILFAGTCFFYSLRDNNRWAHYVEILKDEPGIVVTSTEKRAGKYYIFGLRDPLAPDPVKMLKGANVQPQKVIFHWEPYHSFYPEFMLHRIKAILRPPETMTLKFKDGILHAYGSASNQWIVETRKIVKTIPGIVQFQENNIIYTDLKAIQTIREKIEREFFTFKFASARITSNQDIRIGELVKDIKRLHVLAQLLGKRAYIEIVGHTDSIGSEKTNLKISRERADRVLSMLISKGLKTENFTTTGVGSKEPLQQEISEMDRELNRCATFRVILKDNLL